MATSVWMKQNVLIKTVVTQQFKDSYLKELDGAHTGAKQNLERLKSSLSQVILRGGVGGQYDDLVKAQLQDEKAKQEQMVMDLEAKRPRCPNWSSVPSTFKVPLKGQSKSRSGTICFRRSARPRSSSRTVSFSLWTSSSLHCTAQDRAGAPREIPS